MRRLGLLALLLAVATAVPSWHTVVDLDVDESHRRLLQGAAPSLSGPFKRPDGTLSACPGDWQLLNITSFSETDCPALEELACRPPLCSWDGQYCSSGETAGRARLVCVRRQLDEAHRDETRPSYYASSAFFALGHTYSRVRGAVQALSKGSPDAFREEAGRSSGGEPTIDEPYVDGVSITHGAPRRHIITYVAGLSYGQRGYSSHGYK